MAAAASHKLALRSIHIKIHPTARSLPERREVLRVIERFGEVEMFKSLKYDPTSPVSNAFLLILSTEAAAKAAISASPIRYRLISDSSSEVPGASKDNTPLEDTSSSMPNSETTTPATSAARKESIFELRISPSTFPHAASITSSPVYSSYTPVGSRRSAIAADLATRIPESISKPGLVDWVTDSARVGSSRGLRGPGGKVAWGRGAGVGWEETKPWRLRDKEREKRETEIPWVMRGLSLGGEGQP